MNECIQQLADHFPGKEGQIKQLWASSEDFRELGQDYLLCREAETKENKSAYRPLRQRLEVEILSIVEKWGQ